jgi:glycosyltransferase involved in cell wall biosynthesis
MTGVCIFTETFHPVIGGGETQARLLAEGLVVRGFRVCVLTRRSDDRLPAVEDVGGVRVHRVGPSGGGQLKKWRLALAGVPALIRLRDTYDILFVSGFRIVGAPAALVAKALGKRVVLKADSEGEMSGDFFGPGMARIGLSPRAWWFRALLWMRNLALKRADAFAAINAGVAAEFASAQVPAGALHRIPNAVDTDRFRPAEPGERIVLRRRLGLPESAHIVAYTGRLVSYKGLPLLLDVWPRLLKAQADACLLLIGEGGLDIHNCEQQLRATVHNQGLEGRVIFAGGVQNVPDYLRAADGFVFPTENDAFPSSVVEAMACALPVVTTPVGALAEIVQDGDNGLVVAPRDGTGLERALLRLLTDPDVAARLGRRACQTVRERYSAERVTGQYVELFERLLFRPGSVGRRPS